MAKPNVGKLHRELTDAKLPICGVDTELNISWESEPTKEQLAAASAIIDKHDPTPVEIVTLDSRIKKLEDEIAAVKAAPVI